MLQGNTSGRRQLSLPPLACGMFFLVEHLIHESFVGIQGDIFPDHAKSQLGTREPPSRYNGPLGIGLLPMKQPALNGLTMLASRFYQLDYPNGRKNPKSSICTIAPLIQYLGAS